MGKWASKEAYNAYQVQYKRENYGQVAVRLPLPLVDTFKATVAARGDSQAAIIRQAIEDYLARVEREAAAADKADEEMW